jgi:ArsR family transcriptional regulator
MNDTTNLFKAMSDPTRLRMLVLLERKGPLCVCELTEVLGEVQPKISRHLAELRKYGLVQDQRRGLWVFYRLAAALSKWESSVLMETAKGLKQVDPFSADFSNLRLIASESERCGLPGRPSTREENGNEKATRNFDRTSAVRRHARIERGHRRTSRRLAL